MDLNAILEICKRKIDKKEDVFQYLDNFNDLSEEDSNRLEKEVNKYISLKEEKLSQNQKYWMLICNPLEWGEGEEPFRVNQLLLDLDEECWTINKHTDITHQMKKGHKGIIKVSIDSRNKSERCEENENIVEKLESGIYGIFEVIEDEDGDCTYETENGDWFVNIKMVNNFYKNKRIISKEDAIGFLGENTFSNRQSKKISKESYLKIINFQKI